MKRIGILCSVGGLLMVLGVVWLGPADAQPVPPGGPVSPPTAPLPTPAVSVPQPPPPPVDQKQPDNVYELLTKLASIKAKKAELDKAESETMALLKKELSQLKQQSKKLGVSLEEERESQPAVDLSCPKGLLPRIVPGLAPPAGPAS